MEKVIRQGMSKQNKAAFDTMTKGLKMYLEGVKPNGKRHRYTIIVFEGDRCKPTEIKTRYRAKNKKNDE